VDYTFNYKKTKDGLTGYDYGLFLFGGKDGNKETGMESKLHASTALTQVVVPAKEAGGEFDCTKTNFCVKGQVALCATMGNFSTYNLTYFDTTANKIANSTFIAPAAMCAQDTTFMRWTNSNLDNPAGMKTNLQVVELQSENSNLVEKVGLIGLAPKGALLNYIKADTLWNKDEDSMQLSLSYSPNSGASKLMDTTNEDTWKQNQFIIKGKRNGGDITFDSELVGDGSTWTIGYATFN